jgi:hypothetical protein
MTTKSNNWLEFYKDLASNNQVNLQMEQLASLFAPNVSNEDFIRNLKENPGSFVLAVDHFNNVLLLHQVSILGPSIFQPEQYILALGGAGASASCFRIHPSSFSVPVEETPCPSWGTLKGASSSTEVLALVAPADSTTKIKSRCIVVVPPLVAITIMSESSSTAEDIIPLLTEAFKAFDQGSETVKACTILRHMIFYLWGVTQNKIPPVTMIFDSSVVGASWSTSLHVSSIKQEHTVQNYQARAPPSTNETELGNQAKAFSDISAILNSMRAESDRSRLRGPDVEDDKKDEASGWKSIPPHLQDMIIKASSTSDVDFPTAPNDSLLQILRSKKIISIRTIMNVLLAAVNCNVNVSVSLATAIASANLRSISPQVPHPFSCFSTPYHDASQATTEIDIRMQLMASDGVGVDKATADILAKESHKIPYTTHKLRHQLNNWQGLLQLVFGPNALISKEASRWVVHIDQLETTYDEQFKIDREFGAKVCGLIDRSTYQFLGSCLNASTPEEVDWGLLSLENKRFEIQQNCFIANKPAYLVVAKKPDKDKDNDEDDKDDKNKYQNKRFKKERQIQDPTHLGAMISNTRKNPEWDCKANYHAIFTKQVNRKTPAFNGDGISVCNKWHCQGYCFSDCARSITHKPFTDETLKKNYGEWVKDLKKKFAEKP